MESHLTEWCEAFAKAQANFPAIPKNRHVDTGSFTYNYADLPSILEAVGGHLAAEGLAVAQSVISENGRAGVTTHVYHQSGHVETFGPVFLPSGDNAQSTGSAISYARRYSLCAALGIVADEDDDGRSAMPESDYVEPPEEVMPKATNQLKADLSERVGTELAKTIYRDAATAHGLDPDEAIPKSKMEAMQTEVDARATEALDE